MHNRAIRIQIIPSNLAEANAFVGQHHRHHDPVVGHVFSLAASGSSADSIAQIFGVVGVAIVGRPVARRLDDGWTLEVTRLCTIDGYPNAASALYAACWRAAKALGYRKLVTYTLAAESGASVLAAGWKVVAEVKGRSWHCPSRPRVDKRPLQDKFRWEAPRG